MLPYAFEDLMIRGVLRFTLRIAFRCVLHRCENQDIRCPRSLFLWLNIVQSSSGQSETVHGGPLHSMHTLYVRYSVVEI